MVYNTELGVRIPKENCTGSNGVSPPSILIIACAEVWCLHERRLQAMWSHGGVWHCCQWPFHHLTRFTTSPLTATFSNLIVCQADLQIALCLIPGGTLERSLVNWKTFLCCFKKRNEIPLFCLFMAGNENVEVVWETGAGRGKSLPVAIFPVTNNHHFYFP